MPVSPANTHPARRARLFTRSAIIMGLGGVAIPALAQAPTATCAAAYHTALAELNKSAGDGIAGDFDWNGQGA